MPVMLPPIVGPFWRRRCSACGGHRHDLDLRSGRHPVACPVANPPPNAPPIRRDAVVDAETSPHDPPGMRAMVYDGWLRIEYMPKTSPPPGVYR